MVTRGVFFDKLMESIWFRGLGFFKKLESIFRSDETFIFSASDFEVRKRVFSVKVIMDKGGKELDFWVKRF